MSAVHEHGENAGEHKDSLNNDSSAFSKPELRSSYTTLTYINDDDDDDVTSPEYISAEFNDNNESSTDEKVTDHNQNSTQIPRELHITADEPSAQTQSNNYSSFEIAEPIPNPPVVFSATVHNQQTNFQNTPRITQTRFDSTQTPLTKKRILILKCLSIAAAIFFFPTGIPAVYYAFKINKAFQEGIMQGNIDLALKYAKRTEKLVILSAVLGVLFIVMCFAIIERLVYGNEYYWHTGTVVGH